MRSRVKVWWTFLAAAALSFGPMATPGYAGPNAPDVVSGNGDAPRSSSGRTASAESGVATMNPMQLEGGVVLRLMLGAIGLCALGGCIVYAARRWWPGSASSPGAVGLQVLGRVALSPRHFVCVLRAGEKKIVVGVSGDHMNALTILEDSPAPRADAGPGDRRTELSQRGVTEADLLPYRRQVSRVREMFRGRVDDLSAGIDAP